MVKLEPRGCFVLFHDQERSGIVTSISYGSVGWMGTLIVKEDVRGEGSGKLLVKKIVDYLKRGGAETIGIYAYPHLVKFYESLGFETENEFLVYKGEVKEFSIQESSVVLKKQDVSELINFDFKCFGADRKKLLEPIFLNENNLCYISTENNQLCGYVAAKVYDRMAEIGPLVCHVNHVKEALLLLKTILSRLNGFKVFMYIPKKQTALIKVLSQSGLKEDVSVVRMFSGPAIVRNCIYIAESLERG
jgi:hypothetical protein